VKTRSAREFRPTVLSLALPQATQPERTRALWYVLGFAIGLGAALLATLWYLRQQALAGGEHLAEAMAQVIAEQTARSLETVDQRLEITAHHFEDLLSERGLDATAGRELLRAHAGSLPLVRAMAILDAEGRVVVDTQDSTGRSLADREYFQVLRERPQTGFFVGRLVRIRSSGTDSGRWVLPAARPLLDAGGKFKGVIAAAIEPTYFEALWRRLDLGRGGSIALFHREGQMLVRSPHLPQSQGQDFSHVRLFRQQLPGAAQGVYVGHSALDGVERVTAYRVLPNHPQLVAVVGSPLRQVLADWRRFAWLAGGFWLVAVLGAGVLGLQLRRQFGQLRHLERRFRELAQAMPQIVFIMDARGVVEFVNQRWSEATGLPPEQALGARWAELAHPDEVDRIGAALAAQLRAAEPLEVEMRLRHADGSYRWQLVRAVPNRGAAGQVVSWFGTSTDVHDLKTAHERLEDQARQIGELNATLEQRIAQRTRELARQEALFRTLAEQAPMPIWTVDPMGHVTFFSRAWYELVGGEAPRWLGDQWIQRVHPEDRAAVRENWRRCREEAIPYQGTRRILARDGTWHTTTYRATPVRGDDGEIAFWVGVDADITDLIANESALRQANEHLRAFSYTVSHDLLSPLQRIGGFAQLLQRESGVERAGGKSAHYLQRIVANVDEMGKMLQGLLALSRVTQKEVVPRPVDVSDMARQILQQLHAGTPERGMQWTVEPGIVVLADQGLMHSVMENLLGNAWKFTSRTEQARIEVARLPDGGFCVRDNGAGFDPEQASRLFGTFERLHKQEEFPGTGIGLATVARAVSRQGGRVWAEGRPGQGATFYVSLPVPQ